jgi:hypothetical protein
MNSSREKQLIALGLFVALMVASPLAAQGRQSSEKKEHRHRTAQSVFHCR